MAASLLKGTAYLTGAASGSSNALANPGQKTKADCDQGLEKQLRSA
jgi:hypothetical protein